MTILLKRNSNKDPWFTLHEIYINEGDIVKLVSIENESDRSAVYPPEITVSRGVAGDPREYIASLNCFDYVKETARDS